MAKMLWYMRNGMTAEDAVEQVALDSQPTAYQPNNGALRDEINGRVYRAVVGEEVCHV